MTDLQFTQKATSILDWVFTGLLLLVLVTSCTPAGIDTQSEPAETQPAGDIDTSGEPYAGAVWWPRQDLPGWPTTASPDPCATVTAARSLHMRAGPGPDQAVIKYLYFGDRVQLLDPGPTSGVDSSGSWWKIQAGQTVGYANAKYLREGCE